MFFFISQLSYERFHYNIQDLLERGTLQLPKRKYKRHFDELGVDIIDRDFENDFATNRRL